MTLPSSPRAAAAVKNQVIAARPERVPFLSPTVPPVEDLVDDYRAIIASGVFSNGGRMDRELVAAAEAWVGNRVFATTMCNCTLGIELAVRTCFLDRPRALVPAFTFAAGPLALVSAGYTPEFVDVDPETWQPSLDHAREILDRPGHEHAGILLPATFGVANEYVSEWEQLAEQHALPLVIDSAAGFGAEYSWGERLGSRGTCEIFSIHATKMVAAGEGGLVTSRDPDLIARLNQAKNFGFGGERSAVRWGTNAKLSELTAALARRQLEVLPERLRARRAVQAAYEESLLPLGLRFQPGALRAAPAFVSALMPDRDSRDEALRALADDLIECRMYYNPPVHLQPFFADCAPSGALQFTDELCSRVISLPMADDLSMEVIRRVADIIGRVLQS